MTTALPSRLISLAPLALLVACGTQSGTLPSAPELVIAAHRSFSGWSLWSEPVNLGMTVNSACGEQTPTLSRDQLALYFTSNRRGGFGQDTPDGCQNTTDLWVSRRASRDNPWETPVNLGPVVNTSANEGGANLSPDGQLLFFHSTRPGPGEFDIYLSRRVHRRDDLGWGPPTLVGPGVNTARFELAPGYVKIAEDGGADEDEEQDDGVAILFFHGGLDNGNNADLYSVAVTRHGEARGPVLLISELSAPNFPDGFPSVRRDGREIFFSSGRPGGVSQFDLWTSTRLSVHDAWSPPVNLGTPVNTQFGEFQPDLSFDGRTLVFMAGAGRVGVGGFDIWITTRAPVGQEVEGDDGDDDDAQDKSRDHRHSSRHDHRR
jgi:WD40 repeat protein